MQLILATPSDKAVAIVYVVCYCCSLLSSCVAFFRCRLHCPRRQLCYDNLEISIFVMCFFEIYRMHPLISLILDVFCCYTTHGLLVVPLCPCIRKSTAVTARIHPLKKSLGQHCPHISNHYAQWLVISPIATSFSSFH